MRWVKLTLPPRPRRRWLLMTTRLSMSSFAGTARTLVAVGTVRLASMLATTRAAAPRNGWVGTSCGGVGAAGCFAAAGGEALVAGLAAGLVDGLVAGCAAAASAVRSGWPLLDDGPWPLLPLSPGL